MVFIVSEFPTSKHLVRLACGSRSMTNTFLSSSFNEYARFNVVVVFPTPPFRLAMVIISAIFDSFRYLRYILRYKKIGIQYRKLLIIKVFSLYPYYNSSPIWFYSNGYPAGLSSIGEAYLHSNLVLF